MAAWRLASWLLEAATNQVLALPEPPPWAETSVGTVDAVNLAVGVATYLVVRPLVRVPYRRLVVATLILMVVHGAVPAVDLPRSALIAVGCGVGSGSEVLLALGRPVRPLNTGSSPRRHAGPA